ncbi:MAG: hypothetical protein ACRDRH_05630 [Pseudonocardia sp.]
MPTFLVSLVVPGHPRTDDELDQLQGHPAGWTITGRCEWGSGFRLDLRGDAADPGAAERSARDAAVAWLAENGLPDAAPRVTVRRRLT